MRKLQNTAIIILLGLITLSSCNSKIDKKNKQISTDSTTTSKGYQLLKTNCYACHNPNAESHDKLLAPPMAAIKMRYIRQFNTKKEFVNEIVKWATNPTHENAKMVGAVNQFKVMPNLNFKAEDVKKIATYIFENKLEVPEWFGAHKNQMHQGMQNNQFQKQN